VADERNERLKSAFRERFTGSPTLVRAPGRVNLIGEHTDYNDGYVMPVAIDRDVRIAAGARDDTIVRLYSLDFDGTSEFDLRQVGRDPEQPWSNYVRGVAQQLQVAGLALRGMEGVVEGNVPIAAGLSSSAALEVAAAMAFQAISGFELDPVRMALLCQKAEQEFMGVQVGIMDQFISRLGRAGHALFLDCRTLEYQAVPLNDQGYRFVIADSRASRELAGSEYNIRRRQCEEAVEGLRAGLPGIRALRDVSPADFLRYSASLETTVGRRARHVVSEDDRVLQAVAALREGHRERFGALMNESHESLRFDYEVSSRELNVLVGAARQVDGCLGSRLTGAGFGGCTVSLVREEAVPAFEAHVKREYERQTGRQTILYICRAVDGASVLERGA
jgi:galactokinase